MSGVCDRISALRAVMKSRGADAYIICTEDFHGSEYVGGYFKTRAYFSGFTGSAGTLVVLDGEAALWTDGRYFIQAAAQLEGSGITLMRSGERGVPAIAEYLCEKLPDGARVAFDGRTVSTALYRSWEKALGKKNVTFMTDADLADEVWSGRPPLSKRPVWELPVCFAGKTRAEKLALIREKTARAGADHLIVSALDEIAWTLDLRGGDVDFNPVFLSYMIIGKSAARLFADSAIFPDEIKAALEADGVEILPYEDFYDALGRLPSDEKPLIDPSRANCFIARSIPGGARTVEAPSPITALKAVKNPVELENIRKAHVKDGVALTRFMMWLKTSAEGETEISAAEKLEGFRRADAHYLGASFEPIMAYGEHGAIVHYSANERTNAALGRRGMLLSDTGGHYLEGTTDVTRTFVLGELTEEEKRAFTLVLAGNLELADAVFPKGTRGINLDILAREPLWRNGLDYNHGTGHGVGYLLNVHEGPNRISWRVPEGKVNSAVFEEGMVTSDEPGLYIEGKFGVRHENLVACVRHPEYDGFLGFETLTLVPFDLDGIDPRYLTDRETELLNAYHKRVVEELSPYLDSSEREWLKNAARPIAKPR